MDRRKYNNNFRDVLLEYGYKYIDGEYINATSKFRCYDEDGYIVYVCFNKLENSLKKPRRFHISNDYSVYNIKHFLEEHSEEYGCTYYSGKYINSKSNLTFKCLCGNLFDTTFNNIRSFHKVKCRKCSRYNNYLPYDEVKNNLSKKGYFLDIDKEEFNGICNTNLISHDEDGFKYVRKSHYAQGYYWYDRKDYYNSKFKIMPSRFSKFYIPVDKYDKSGRLMCSYETILDAARDLGVNNYAIYSVIIGKKKSIKGFNFKKSK